MASTQTYANHTRWNPLHHFFVAPIIGANLVVRVLYAVRHPSGDAAWSAVVALALCGLVAAARLQALTVQNRVIRLETRLRLAALLPPELGARIPELRLGQLLGLRFASDAELPALVARCLSGELADARAVKRAVTDWQPDHLRA